VAERRPAVSIAWKPLSGQLLVRAWVEDENRATLSNAINVATSSVRVLDLEGNSILASGSADPSGAHYVRFTLENVNLVADAHYQLSAVLRSTAGGYVARGILPIPTRR